MLEIEVKREVYKEIKDMNDDAFNRYLRNKLKLLVMELENHSEEKLMEKRENIKQRINKLLEEIRYLSEFSNRAENDKKSMEEWVEKLDKENQKLLEALRHGRSND